MSIKTMDNNSVREKIEKYMRYSDMEGLSYIIKQYIKNKQVYEAVNLIELLLSNNMRPHLHNYTICVNTLGNIKNYNKLVDILEMMKFYNVEMNTIIYNAFITAFGKCGRYEKSLKLLQEMKYNNIKVDVITYSACMTACNISNRGDITLNLLQEARKQNIAINQIIYGAALKACRNIDNMENILTNMHEDSILPNNFIYAICMKIYMSNNYYLEVINLYNQMISKNIKRDIVIYSIVISAYTNMSKYDEIIKLMSNEDIKYDSTLYKQCKEACMMTNNMHLLTDNKLDEIDDISNIHSQLDKYIDNKGIALCDKIMEVRRKINTDIHIKINRGKYSYKNRREIINICKATNIKYTFDIAKNILILTK